ncbi:MAG TPA: response regulator [Methylophilaceae bacterium]|jgi:two-component system, NtrC family, response regulator GlrR|nr:response regulator [Methylophilaceae bacterium]
MINNSQQQKSRITILLVDDDPDILKLMAMRLRAAGYDVISVSNGEAALAHIALNSPNLVITDLRMPGMDGLTLFNAIRATRPLLPVIIVTAHGSEAEALNALQRGVFDFLSKPFDNKYLLQQIESALRKFPQPAFEQVRAARVANG